MPRAAPGSNFPFSVATTAAARTLIRIYQRLMGEALKHKRGERSILTLAEVHGRMAELEAVLRFMDVDFDPAKLKPKRDRPKKLFVDFGDLRRGVIALLKASQDWMTPNQLADALAAKHGLKLSADDYKHFLQKTREAAHALYSEGLLMPEHKQSFGNDGRRQRWKLSAAFDD